MKQLYSSLSQIWTLFLYEMAIKMAELFNAKAREKSGTFIALDSKCSENPVSDPILYTCE